jgi:hypothetical protein
LTAEKLAALGLGSYPLSDGAAEGAAFQNGNAGQRMRFKWFWRAQAAKKVRKR